MVLSYDSLRHLTATYTLKTKRHRTYAVQCFRLLFNKESHYGEFVRQCSFTLSYELYVTES